MATGYEKPITVKTVISATARFHSSSLLSHTYLKCVCVKHSRSVELTAPVHYIQIQTKRITNWQFYNQDMWVRSEWGWGCISIIGLNWCEWSEWSEMWWDVVKSLLLMWSDNQSKWKQKWGADNSITYWVSCVCQGWWWKYVVNRSKKLFGLCLMIKYASISICVHCELRYWGTVLLIDPKKNVCDMVVTCVDVCIPINQMWICICDLQARLVFPWDTSNYGTNKVIFLALCNRVVSKVHHWIIWNRNRLCTINSQLGCVRRGEYATDCKSNDKWCWAILSWSCLHMIYNLGGFINWRHKDVVESLPNIVLLVWEMQRAGLYYSVMW